MIIPELVVFLTSAFLVDASGVPRFQAWFQKEYFHPDCHHMASGSPEQREVLEFMEDCPSPEPIILSAPIYASSLEEMLHREDIASITWEDARVSHDKNMMSMAAKPVLDAQVGHWMTVLVLIIQKNTGKLDEQDAEQMDAWLIAREPRAVFHGIS